MKEVMLYQAVKSFEKDWTRYWVGEIVEVVEINARVYKPSTIVFKGRTGFEDIMEVKEFREHFVQDIQVDKKTSMARTKQSDYKSRMHEKE